jgi:hypothetical protein
VRYAIANTPYSFLKWEVWGEGEESFLVIINLSFSFPSMTWFKLNPCQLSASLKILE